MPPNFEPPTSPSPAPPPLPQQRPNIPPPRPNPLRQDHSIPVGEQHTVDMNSLPKSGGSNWFQSSQPNLNNPGSPYDFILNPEKPKRSISTRMPLTPIGRLGTIGGIIVGLIILIVIVSSLFSGSSSAPVMVSVLQDQQELIHISNSASQEPDISSTNQNFAATARLSLGSDLTVLESYLSSAGTSVSTSSLILKESPATDKLLSNSEASGDFNSTYDSIVKQQLNSYLSDIVAAYNQAKGPRGRSILRSDYNQAKLLMNGLNSGS